MKPLYCVVVSYNSALELAMCLKHIVDIPDSVTVVVDNASSDESLNVAELFGVQIIQTGANIGFGKAVNRALSERPKGSDVLLVNPDCEVPGSSVRAMQRRLQSTPDLGIVAPIMQYRDGTYGISGGSSPSMLKEIIAATGIDRLIPRRPARVLLRRFRRVLPVGFGQYLGTQPADELIPTQWVSGFCMMIRNAVVDDIDGFDNSFFMYFEDVDLCVRAKNRGWQIGIDGGAVAIHDESASALKAGKSRLYYDGLLTYTRLHRGPLAQWSAAKLRDYVK